MYLVIAISFSSESFSVVHFLIDVFVVTKGKSLQDVLAGKGAYFKILRPELHLLGLDGERRTDYCKLSSDPP